MQTTAEEHSAVHGAGADLLRPCAKSLYFGRNQKKCDEDTRKRILIDVGGWEMCR